LAWLEQLAWAHRMDELVGHDPVVSRRTAGPGGGHGNARFAREDRARIEEIAALGHEGGEVGHQVRRGAIAAQAVKCNDERGTAAHWSASRIDLVRETSLIRTPSMPAPASAVRLAASASPTVRPVVPWPVVTHTSAPAAFSAATRSWVT